MLRIDQGGGVLCASCADINGDGILNVDTTITSAASPYMPYGEYYKSLSSYPTAGYDANNNIYCVYSSVTEGTNFGDGRSFRNIWGIKHLATDNDSIWSDPANITNDDFSESVYPAMGKKVVNGNVQFIFQNDYEPGLCVQPSTSNPNTDFDMNDIRYLTYSFNTGVKEYSNISNISIYPNPSHGVTNVSVSLTKTSNVTISVTDMLGQVVYEMNEGMVNAGSYIYPINSEMIKSGIYFYTVRAGNQAITNKLVVE